MKDTKIRQLVLSAMFAALCCVATMSVKVPSLTKGYVNIGDSIVLLSAWLIGGAYGALAAGIGSAMADLLSGYSHYVPGTLVIKFLMALFAWLVFTALVKRKAPKTAAYIVSAVVAEVTMILGYFTYQFTILGYGIGAAASVSGNIMQGITCSLIGIALMSALNAAKVPTKFFAGQH